MPRLSRNALSAAMVRSAGPGNYVDGNGLMLRVRKSGSRQWIQRLTIHSPATSFLPTSSHNTVPQRNSPWSLRSS